MTEKSETPIYIHKGKERFSPYEITFLDFLVGRIDGVNEELSATKLKGVAHHTAAIHRINQDLKAIELVSLEEKKRYLYETLFKWTKEVKNENS